MAKRHDISLARSSAAEYLTFVAATGGGVKTLYNDAICYCTKCGRKQEGEKE